MTSKQFGDLGENLANKHLAKLGFNIVCKNFRCPYGEIDIIATDEDVLVFVEVKTRKTRKFGTPAEAVTKSKQEKICITAEHYIFENNLYDKACRFDVIEIFFYAHLNEYSVNHIKNAFWG